MSRHRKKAQERTCHEKKSRANVRNDGRRKKELSKCRKKVQARAEIGKMCRAGSGGQAEAGRSGRRAGTSGPEAGRGERAEIGRKQAGAAGGREK